MARKYAAKKLTVRLSEQEWGIVQQISESEGVDYNDVIREAVRKLGRGLKSPSGLSP
ncbi:CopG family transcriptional regulator [Scytonema sp. PRP1]|jgi:predicted DNA binding CopG/RHH family protein|uniref:CopG family transcriptional regulator n=1 Tax=Scytonema sp. PRP1 TaxID=3120513 RepID=UPI002FD1C5D4